MNQLQYKEKAYCLIFQCDLYSPFRFIIKQSPFYVLTIYIKNSMILETSTIKIP